MKYLIYLTLLTIWTVGCSNNTSKELVIIDIEKKTLTYRSEFAQWSLLSFTEFKDIEYVTPLSSTCIGQYVTESDPNSITSTGSLLGEAIKSIID